MGPLFRAAAAPAPRSGAPCPDHGWTIDLRSGVVEAPDRGEVSTFPVRMVDGQVFVSVPSPGGRD